MNRDPSLDLGLQVWAYWLPLFAQNHLIFQWTLSITTSYTPGMDQKSPSIEQKMELYLGNNSHFQKNLIFFFFSCRKWVSLIFNPCKLWELSSKYDLTTNWGRGSTILEGLAGDGTSTTFRKESGVGFFKGSLSLLPTGREVSVRWHVRSRM